MDSTDDKRSETETAQLRDDAIRRALNSPPKPNSDYVGKGERAQSAGKSRVKKTSQE
jgi:hypothetical protein